MKIFQLSILFSLVAFTALNCFIANAADNVVTNVSAPESYAPAVLPGNGLAQHPFLYTGEWDHRKTNQTIFVVRDGKVAWTYSIPINDANGTLQELGDATMLSNGNIVFCRKVGASEITPDKKIIWNIDAPKGTEIHSVQPLGLIACARHAKRQAAKLMIINTATGATEKELDLPTPHPDKSPHLQFRRVHLTKDGTYLAAHLDDNKVVEYDADGKAVWSFATPGGPWDAVRLKNGNTLISSYHNTVLEVNKKGEVVWQFSAKDIPEYKCFIFQEVNRLANGDTLICNWCPIRPQRHETLARLGASAGSVAREKSRLGIEPMEKSRPRPGQFIQLLDEPGVAENGDLQR
jgi:outer membrane protein assembly factor BamB